MSLDARLERAVIDALAYGLKHDAFAWQPAQEAVAWWLHGAREPWIAELILDAVALTRERVAVGEQPPFASPPGWPDGVIGGLTRWDGQLVWLPLAAWTAGVLVTGETGGGKTTLALQQCCGLARCGVGVLWVDTAKRGEGRTLRGMLAPYGIDCAVVTGEDLRLNSFDREEAKLVPYATFLSDLLKFVLELRDLGAVLMYQLLLDRYATNAPFTLLDLLQDWLAADRNRLATESAVERFRRFVLATPDGVRRVRRGWSVDDLVGPGRCCVLELDALHESVQQWVVLPIMWKLFRRGVEAGR